MVTWWIVAFLRSVKFHCSSLTTNTSCIYFSVCQASSSFWLGELCLCTGSRSQGFIRILHFPPFLSFFQQNWIAFFLSAQPSLCILWMQGCLETSVGILWRQWTRLCVKEMMKSFKIPWKFNHWHLFSMFTTLIRLYQLAQSLSFSVEPFPWPLLTSGLPTLTKHVGGRIRDLLEWEEGQWNDTGYKTVKWHRL